MGREIRRVPPDWEHPRYTKETAPYANRVGAYKPLFDEDYEAKAEQWMKDFDLWRAGVHPEQPYDFARYFWEYSSPPDAEFCRERRWTPEEATHYQMYETVSEGTPVTPVFATKAELVGYLVAHGDFWDQQRMAGGWDRAAAEQFVEAEWAPSLMTKLSAAGVEIREPRDGRPT
jgi:hypothetical protein